MLRRYAYDKKAFDEPFDGIVYSVMVAMGFATIENVGYVYQHGIGTGVMRMFLSVPAHGSFAVMMGYYVGMAKFKPGMAYVLRTVGIFWAVILHGSYDTLLLLGQNGVISAYVSRGLLVTGAFVSYFIGIRLSLTAIKKQQQLSKELYEQKLPLL